MKQILLNTILIFFLWNSVNSYTSAANDIPDSSDALRNSVSNNSLFDMSKYQISAGYWNDNFMAYQKLLNGIIKNGEDDFVTASLWLQIALENPEECWFLDIYYNILTNKLEHYRNDLLTVRLSIEKETSLGFVQAGSGIITSGNFGGSNLQNGYHRIFDIDRLSLPYIEKYETGLIAFFRYKPIIWRCENFSFKGFASNSFRTAAGPSNFRTGIELNAVTQPVRKSYIFHFQTQVGYSNYYSLGKYLSPLFENGFSWGMLLSGGYTGKFKIATWITGNQYGLKQPHFGVSFIFGWNGRRLSNLSDLSDFTFP